MRVLLLHPEDSPREGPWSRQHWDLIVDLGKSSAFSEEAWSRQYGCPILRTDCFRNGIADVKRVGQIFSAGQGCLIDEQGIDWWNLMSLLVAEQAFSLPALQSLAKEISSSAEVWSTRAGGPAAILALLLDRRPENFGDNILARTTSRASHYAGVLRRFSPTQINGILLDKYDAGYRWRSRFAMRARSGAEPLVLVPSAYENVSRMAASYIRLLPEQAFLMLTTRLSAKQFVLPPNLHVRDLAAYAKTGSDSSEATSLVERWEKVKLELQSHPDLRVLSEVGVFDRFPSWLRDGIRVRNAWSEVFNSEAVQAVLCGDDTNIYTKLPVLLARKQKIRTVDFHHGALDGRYLLKELCSDVYMAKNAMERDYLLRICGLASSRVGVCAPPPSEGRSTSDRKLMTKTSAVLFSEPYEAAGMRAEEVYRELLPPLCRVARENRRGVIVKLHPFESHSQRQRIIQDILAPEDRELITVLDGPLTDQLISRTWFGITVESTTAIDCRQNGICCFLCGWLSLSPYEYVLQYARFEVGEVLQEARQIEEIPQRVAKVQARGMRTDLQGAGDPAILKQWLTGSRDLLGSRVAS